MTKLVTQLQQDVEDMKDRKEEADNKASDGLEVDEDVPSDEQIESMEEKLETAQSDQKNLFLIIFQVCLRHSWKIGIIYVDVKRYFRSDDPQSIFCKSCKGDS